MRNWFSKKSNIVFILILAVVLYQQVPVQKNNFEQTDKTLSTQRTFSYSLNELIDFPLPNKKSLAIFWATWCTPCKLEMKRLKSSVESGSIPKDAIFAINPFESADEIKKFLHSESYPFNFIESSIAKDLGVQVTPTTIFINNRKIDSMSTGLSLWGIWKAEWYL